MAELEDRIASVEDWYHCIELAPGVVTPGAFDMRPFVDHYHFPDDFAGASVVDVGAANGFFSFEAEKRGAKVTAYDLPTWQDHDIPLWWFREQYANQTPEERRWDDHHRLHGGFDLAREALGSSVEKVKGRIYELPEKVSQRFDYAIFSNVLLHLRDPLKALECVHEILKPGGCMILSTATSPWEPDHAYAGFMGDYKTASYWFPSTKGLVNMCAMMGFRDVEVVGSYELPRLREPLNRADIVVLHGRRRA